MNRVVRVLETPPASPRRRLFANENYGYEDANSFFKAVRQMYKIRYNANVELTNNDIKTGRKFPVAAESVIAGLLNRPLTTTERSFLGQNNNRQPVRQRTAEEMEALMSKYAVSPLKKQKHGEKISYYDDTMTMRSPNKVPNKVFLMTELNGDGRVKYVYSRSAITRLNKSPFNRKPFLPHHIKNFNRKNIIEQNVRQLLNLGLNKNSVIEKYSQGQLRNINDMNVDLVTRVIRAIKSKRTAPAIRELLKKRLALLIIRPNLHRQLGISRVTYALEVRRLHHTIPERLQLLF